MTQETRTPAGQTPGLGNMSSIGIGDGSENAPKTARTQAEKSKIAWARAGYLRHGEFLIKDPPKRLWCKIQCKSIWERSAFVYDVLALLAHARKLEKAGDEIGGAK